MRTKCFAQEHDTWPGLEFRPLAPESNTLTIWKMVDFELDEEMEKGVFLVSSQVQDKLKNSEQIP